MGLFHITFLMSYKQKNTQSIMALTIFVKKISEMLYFNFILFKKYSIIIFNSRTNTNMQICSNIPTNIRISNIRSTPTVDLQFSSNVIHVLYNLFHLYQRWAGFPCPNVSIILVDGTLYLLYFALKPRSCLSIKQSSRFDTCFSHFGLCHL